MDNETSKSAEKAPSNSGFSAKIAEYKGEFKRIIWPSADELKKHTVTVIITCILFGIIIFAMDLVFNQGMSLIARLVG